MQRLCILLLPFLLIACGTGDDDGQRLGELIVGTWYRGWAEGDVVIEGNTILTPENLTYDHFVFSGDGEYNGMVRKGEFASYDTDGNLINRGHYQCDNSNLKLQATEPDPLTILAQVEAFSGQSIRLRYVYDEAGITVTLVLHRQRGTPSR